MLRQVSALLVVLAAAPGAQQGSPPAILKAGPTQIVGRVVEAGSSSGVAGAVVSLAGPALGASTSVFENGIAGGPRRILTDAQGQFRFRDLPPGSYTLSSTAAGYVDGLYGETRTITIRRTLDITRTLDLTETDRSVPVQISMWKLGGISGRLLDEAGEPLAGAVVTVFARVTDWGGPIMQQAANATTDDRGMYHVDVTPGDYVIAFHNATITSPMSLVAGVQQAMADGDAALRKYLAEMPMSSDVSIARGVGVRVGNHTVMLRNNILTSLPALISLGGRLMLYASAYHPASLTASSAGLVTVRSGEEKTGIDVHVQLIEARRVSGRLLGPNGPMAGRGLLLIPDDAATLRTSPATLFDMPGATTDANGEFAFVGVSPGRYLLRAYALDPASVSNDALLWHVQAVTVPADSDVDGLQLSLKPGVRVSGRIVVESPKGATPNSQQLRQIVPYARPLPGSAEALLSDGGRAPGARPDDARFTCSPSIPGPHMMTVAGVPPGWILKSVTSGGQNIVDKPFDLAGGGLSDVVVTITDQISTLSGIVRDANGNAASGSVVAAFPQDRSLWRLPGMASRRVQTALPGRDGRYSFRGLPAGDYIVVAVDGGAPDFSDPGVLTPLSGSGSRVTISDGETRTQDLRAVVMR
ncbi:MAG TPA: carboxypeptidase-like regulatory domain-containing protein [Vicinamibacterales bacterium]|nr:carboxypeptidase-like regulatory domain-containing protein [Vicinamibacterales bacterium]